MISRLLLSSLAACVLAATPVAGAVASDAPDDPTTRFPGCTAPGEVGAPVASLGRVDDSSREFALAPAGSNRLPATDPAVDLAQPGAAGRVPYVLPGPGDAFAGGRAHSLTLRFPLRAVPAGGLRFVAWLADTADAGSSSIRIGANDAPPVSTSVPRGAGRGIDGHPGSPTAIDADLPASALHAGRNTVTITRAEGSWLTLDALGVYGHRTTAGCQRRVVTGTIGPAQSLSFVYPSVDVPRGTGELSVRQDYGGRGPNAVDLGAFDPDGRAIGTQAGFRGWSGGARSDFTIRRDAATPGYLPGPVQQGRWSVVLGPYTIAPEGTRYTLEVTTRQGHPGGVYAPSPPRARVNHRPGWYRGDLHLHTVHSDGRYRPEQTVARARAAGLDFFVSTDHNTTSANEVWGRYAPRSLLVVPGEEVTTRGGHWGAIGIRPDHFIDFRYGAGSPLLRGQVAAVHADGGVAAVNHPHASCVACGWSFPYAGMDVVEVWNGRWDAEDEASLADWDARLRAGRYQPLEGASDAHRDPDGIGLPQTVVGARSLSRDAVVAALRNGRSYVAKGAATRLGMTVRARGGRPATFGGRVRGAGAARVRVRLRGAPADAVVSLHDQTGAIRTARAGALPRSWMVDAARSDWVRVEVRAADGTALALGNPVFLTHR